MDDRNKRLVEAALVVFSRYGIGKTTMNDIAGEAGVARQTLYNAYPNKQAVLRATVRYFADKTIEAVEAAWTDQPSFAGKLDVFFQFGPLGWYDAIQASPEAADLIDNIHSIANDELNDAAVLWTQRITTLVLDHSQAGSATHKDAAALADFIYTTSINSKLNAADRAAMETRLSILKQAVLSMIQGDLRPDAV